MKPIILLVPYKENGKYILSDEYTTAVKMVGGLPIIMPYLEDKKDIEELINKIDGIILTGGGDIDGQFFGQENHEEANTFDLWRDKIEIEICRHALKKDIPLLGICRGMQILNVASGGTMIQHIENHIHIETRNEPKHKVKFLLDSPFENIYKTLDLEVNSIHHQVVDKLGDNICVGGFSEDGYVEAIYSEKNKFIIGVQWHPENLFKNYEIHLEIFKKFFESVKK